MKDNFIIIFLKGLLMGIADIIPGVSGGTMAFITGIYTRLINGIKNVGDFILYIPKNFKKKKFFDLSNIDFKLFIPLILGILLAFVLGSNFISNLMTFYPAQIYSFFIGLILASALLIFIKIKSHAFKEILFGFLGLIIGILISIIPVTNSSSEPSLIFIFLLGAIALCAMILPGISGAYIVMMFGQLKFMYDSISNFLVRWPYLLAFGLGGIIGLLSFSKLLNYLLKNYESRTFYFLTGLMVGAIVSPFKIVISELNQQNFVFSYIISFSLLILGFVLVFFIERFAVKKIKVKNKNKR